EKAAIDGGVSKVLAAIKPVDIKAAVRTMRVQDAVQQRTCEAVVVRVHHAELIDFTKDIAWHLVQQQHHRQSHIGRPQIAAATAAVIMTAAALNRVAKGCRNVERKSPLLRVA